MDYLADISTRAPKEVEKGKIKEETEPLLNDLLKLQNLLYANNNYSVLIILQGMDASGKDGAVNKVFGRINPQGIEVQSFKTPTPEEKAHDFLWRIHQHTPKKGMIQVFNRSHYEDVLISRVHGWCDDELAKKRFKAINDFEELLAVHNNTLVFKFYLHISQEEQQKRFKEREEDETKKWKFNENDLKEATYWDEYMKMYNDVFNKCRNIPWHIIPSDQNWYKEYKIASIVKEGLAALKLKYPQMAEK